MSGAIGDLEVRAESVLAFVAGVELPSRRQSRGVARREPKPIDSASAQSVAVGAGLVSFVPGVSADTRRDILNCSLLAQLAANKQVADRTKLTEWYDCYFDTLTRLGWIVQEKGFVDHSETGDDLEVDKAILAIATAVLGPAAAALAVIKSTLDAMRSMAKGRWITIFKRESETGKAARFQVTLAQPSAESASMVALMAFDLETKVALTQVLFFKFRSTDIRLRHASGQATINPELMNKVRASIAARVLAYTEDFIDELPI
jgi:hypothetical protein